MVIPPGYAQINLIFTGDALPTGAQCAFGVDNNALGLNAEDLATSIAVAYGTAGLAANIGIGVNLTAVMAKLGPNATGPSAVVPTSENGSAGTPAAPNTSWLAHKNTPFGGRAGRGRMYLPGVPEASIGPDGIISSSPLGALQVDLTAFLDKLTADETFFVLLHGVGSPIQIPSVVQSLTVDTKVATQRRRLRR